MGLIPAVIAIWVLIRLEAPWWCFGLTYLAVLLRAMEWRNEK